MSVSPYLNFAGNCRQVVEYYAQVFGTEPPQIMRFADMPVEPDRPLPPGTEDLVMHANLMIAGTSVMFSDVFPGMEFKVGNNISLTVISENREEIETWFHRLAEHGTVNMDLQETFWSKAYGNLTDRFGTEWQFVLDSGEMMP